MKRPGLNQFFIYGLLLTSLVWTSCGNSNESRRPNVVFILADDFGAHDLSCLGSQYYETPNLDRIARRGTIFTRGYAGSRVCSPSRATIMTGQFTARHGITDWIGAYSGARWREFNRHDLLLPAEYMHQLPASDIVLPEVMKSNGYKTFFAGKWHLGEEGSYPEDHGFDINKGGWEKGSPIGGYFSPWENPKLENTTPGENLSMRLGKETANFIKEHKDLTFFAYLAFYAVHSPIQTTQEKWKKYRDKAVAMGVDSSGFEMERVLPIRKYQDNPVYAGLVEAMDDAIGVVLAALKENGLEDNTIVIFTSDNGGVASGDAFSTSNSPLRGGKGYQWEGGIREPYFIYVPWLSEAKEVETPVTGADFFPTILELCGIDQLPEQHKDGVSLVPLLKGEELPGRPLYWHYPHYGNQGGNPSSIIQIEDLKLIHYWEDGHNELYDLSKDTGEEKDIASEFPDQVTTMQTQLIEWLNSVGAKYPEPDLEFDQEKSDERKAFIVNERWPNLERQRIQMLSPDYQPNKDWWGSRVTD
ncbi:MAG: sulfatase [Bacteroidota bacterium]